MSNQSLNDEPLDIHILEDVVESLGIDVSQIPLILDDLTIDLAAESEVTQEEPPKRKFYFVNELVEWELTQYLWSGCTRVSQRDAIMSHATELIRQIIRKQGLHTIYPGQEESAFGDLLQTAWCQIERTLYKYRAKPHCRKCFNPDRPNDSSLYQPGDLEYGIKSIGDLIDMGIEECPKCRRMLTPGPFIEAKRDFYGGTDTVLYRGISKVFNMWCVAPNTQVIGCCGLTTISERIERFRDGHSHVYGLDGMSPIQASKLREISDSVIIATSNGYGIECSPEHQLLTLVDDGPIMKEVCDLKLGDLLGIQLNQQIFGNLKSIPFEINGLIYNLTIESAYIIGRAIPGESTHSVDDHDLTALMVHLDLINGPTLDDRSIPAILLKMVKPLLVSMLAGLFDRLADVVDGTIRLTTLSKTLHDQIKMIMSNLGMLSTSTIDKSHFVLTLYGQDVSRFYQSIVPSSTRNWGVYESSNSTGEIVYGLGKIFKRFISKHGQMGISDEMARLLVNPNGCCLGDVHHITNWCEHYEDGDEAFINARINEAVAISDRVIWLPISSLISSRSELCEISVDSDSSTYIANSIISHNSQVSRTVILAYIKKEGRDRKNSPSYMTYLDNRNKPVSDTMNRFLVEARELCRYNDQYLQVIDALEWLLHNDDKPYDGIIGKLVSRTDLPRTTITGMMKLIRLRSYEFTDSPINREIDACRSERRRVSHSEFDDQE